MVLAKDGRLRIGTLQPTATTSALNWLPSVVCSGIDTVEAGSWQ
jgi:hypothetical protein